jgi:quercetin dioxygenase-like cupin family protein
MKGKELMTTTRGVVQTQTKPVPLRICLNSADSDGGVAVVEMVLDPATGPPLHLHPTHGEGCYVLTGQPTVQIGGQIVSGGPGTWAFAPRNTPHTLAKLTSQEVRLLCVFAPAGFERRFERILAEQAGQQPPERSAAEQETRTLGPPLTARAPGFDESAAP